MTDSFYHMRRELLSRTLSGGLQVHARIAALLPSMPRYPARWLKSVDAPPRAATGSNGSRLRPEDFRPLENQCFQNPYPFYQLLRDEYPVYRLSNGIYCISRYQDIVDISRDVETYSSSHQGIVAGLKPGQKLVNEVARFEQLSALGLAPADVLATSDPPAHTTERKIGHNGLGVRLIKQIESEVEALCRTMMHEFLPKGRVEFMQDFAWRLPMLLIIRLLGLPEGDFEKIKQWCVSILNSQSGIQSAAELSQSRADALTFLRYCWRYYLLARSRPRENLIGLFVRMASAGENGFDDKKAVSAIFQLLIAGSDSSATTMGNALKMLIERPDIQQELRNDADKIPAFIEEVLRLESAFQGHFRWNRRAVTLHGVPLPEGSRIFLMWASGNRDERVFPRPDELILDRPNGKRHLTFGHGIHACLGRELARMEIRIVLKEFLQCTDNLRIAGPTPFVASMFARTLLQLPVQFEARHDKSF